MVLTGSGSWPSRQVSCESGDLPLHTKAPGSRILHTWNLELPRKFFGVSVLFAFQAYRSAGYMLA